MTSLSCLTTLCSPILSRLIYSSFLQPMHYFHTLFFKVAVGMYRLGPSTASSILGVYPDIAVYGKMLSGGYMPLAATLATSETFDAFLGKKKWHALLHGHSFTVSYLYV